MPWSPAPTSRSDLPDVHAAGDVGRLLVDAHEHLARVAREALRVDRREVVDERREADLAHLGADDRVVVELRLRRDLAEHHHHVVLRRRLARDLRVRVPLRHARSSTASETWSASLSGWPSLTDSDENMNSRSSAATLTFLALMVLLVCFVVFCAKRTAVAQKLRQGRGDSGGVLQGRSLVRGSFCDVLAQHLLARFGGRRGGPFATS